MNNLPSSRTVSFSAFRAGSLASIASRPASWSSSQLVVVAGFRNKSAAVNFAARWSKRIRNGHPLHVHKVKKLFVVRVLAAGRSSGRHAGMWITGGVRGFILAMEILRRAPPERIRMAGGFCNE